jgi:hypothetical protein
MVYNTQELLDIFFSSSGVLGSRNTTFRKLDLFPLSGEVGEKTPAHLGPLEKANLNHWTIFVRFAEVFNYSRPG